MLRHVTWGSAQIWTPPCSNLSDAQVNVPLRHNMGHAHIWEPRGSAQPTPLRIGAMNAFPEGIWMWPWPTTNVPHADFSSHAPRPQIWGDGQRPAGRATCALGSPSPSTVWTPLAEGIAIADTLEAAKGLHTMEGGGTVHPPLSVPSGNTAPEGRPTSARSPAP